MSREQTRAFLFNSCARCGGDSYLDRTEQPADWRCLQCGRLIDARDGSDGGGDVVRGMVAELEPAA